MTSAIALKTLFGLEAQGDRERLDGSLRLAFDLLTARLDWPIQVSLWLPTPANLRLRRAITALTQVVDGFIAAGRARRPPGNDLLSTMIAAQHEDGTQMSDRQLRDEAMTLYLAGHETTALTLAWTWYLLSQHPRVEEKLANEWGRVLGARAPGADDLARLPYTAAVIAESMRLYPPVYALGREATTELELGGYRVKRGLHCANEPVGEPPRPQVFPRAGAVLPRTLGGWTAEKAAEVRLLSVRRGTTNVRRQSFRQR